MNVTKIQIINGVIKYAKNEIVNNITDKPVKMMFAAGVKSLELVPSVADKFFNNSIVSTIIQDENGLYNLDNIYQILTETMTEYGDFPVTIPVIKTPLIFRKSDVAKLKEYIEGGAEL